MEDRDSDHYKITIIKGGDHKQHSLKLQGGIISILDVLKNIYIFKKYKKFQNYGNVALYAILCVIFLFLSSGPVQRFHGMAAKHD